eukprot:754856-Hanusia_phi.AAC.8
MTKVSVQTAAPNRLRQPGNGGKFSDFSSSSQPYHRHGSDPRALIVCRSQACCHPRLRASARVSTRPQQHDQLQPFFSSVTCVAKFPFPLPAPRIHTTPSNASRLV